ncbi:carboxypeptidase regulatory-like domain-containing protein [Mesonia maritima]|uniref:Tol biopolymer transport system component n=1 Tax=Mesonia maritima TaxID=1793873 RepID=A0ABU1K4Q6_9FLAO|nr:carboxypeptidase regulatory-like domain-containing protein [Mesonia maritima]MDR6300600.1 Tol biopolymer transport system component [Mesonia maritima]
MKNKIYLSLFISFLTLSFIACQEDTLEDSSVGTITGKVVLEGSNEPVENAKISTNPATSTVFTNAKGEFSLEEVPVEEYSVQAQKDGLLAEFEGATVTANNTVNLIFEMQPESVLNKAPKAPQPISPADNATDLDNTIEFVWNSSDTDKDEIIYTLELRNEIDDDVLVYQNITDTTYTVNNLGYNRKYFWQVSASDGKAEEVRSEVFSFRTLEVPQARKLVTRTVNGNSIIYSVDDEGNTFQLTESSTNSFRPRKNIETNKIAFLRTVGGQTHIFTMNSDGSNIIQVTSNVPVAGFNLDKVDFSWADNGNSIVYPNFTKLYKINASGGGTTQLYQTSDGSFITECNVSEDDAKIALITNNVNGYNAKIFVINQNGAIINTVIQNQPGAVGGLEFSTDGDELLYTRDLSGFENPNYRQLNSHMFIYNFTSQTATDISQNKPAGTNDLDPRFSPTGAEVIFVNTNNDALSEKRVFVSNVINTSESRELLISNASMPDWE